MSLSPSEVIALIAFIGSATGFYLFLMKPLAKKPGPVSPEERRAQLGFILMIFVFFLFVIARYCYLWIIRLNGDSFLSADSDAARVAYETRNILGYAETVAIASIGIFLPLLILLWNSSRQALLETLHKLLLLKGSANVNAVDLENCIRAVHGDLRMLKEIGSELRVFFWVTVIGSVVFLTSLAIANFTPGRTSDAYVFVIVQKGFALVLVLWLLTLLWIHYVLVQPIMRETRHLQLFGLQNL